MWAAETEQLEPGRVLRLRFTHTSRYVSYAEFLRALAQQAEFRDVFMHSLREAPFVAFRWESLPVNATTLEQQYECVLLNSSALDVPADARDFQPYFIADEAAVSFANLGGDAQLVVPCPRSEATNYCNIASFHRSAPLRQQHQLWVLVANTVSGCLGPAPLWLNTAGGGVDWLHVRLDSRPKYYGFQRYRTWPGAGAHRL